MIEISIPTLKIVAKKLAYTLENSIDNPIELSTKDFQNLVAVSHGYLNLEAVPNSKIKILNKLSTNLLNSLSSMKYDQERGLTSSTLKDITAKMYGYKNYHVFRKSQDGHFPSEMLDDYEFLDNDFVLYRKPNKGFKEDNENWLDLSIIYIRISKPSKKAIDIINKTSGIKFLTDTETKIFFDSYNMNEHAYPGNLDKNDTILKFTDYRFSPTLLTGIEDRYKDIMIQYNENDIKNSMLESIDHQLLSLLDLEEGEYDLLYPQAYIIDNTYYNIVGFHDDCMEYIS